MSRRPRNKIAQLCLEHRNIVIEMLLDGSTYDAIRDALRDAGVVDKAIPGNSSFAAYQKGSEYRIESDKRLGWKRRAAEKKQIWNAIQAGGGSMALANIAVFESLEQLLDIIRTGEADPDAVARIAGAISGLKRTLIQDEKLHLVTKIQHNAEKISDAAKGATDTAEVAEVIMSILGVTA